MQVCVILSCFDVSSPWPWITLIFPFPSQLKVAKKWDIITFYWVPYKVMLTSADSSCFLEVSLFIAGWFSTQLPKTTFPSLSLILCLQPSTVPAFLKSQSFYGSLFDFYLGTLPTTAHLPPLLFLQSLSSLFPLRLCQLEIFWLYDLISVYFIRIVVASSSFFRFCLLMTSSLMKYLYSLISSLHCQSFLLLGRDPSPEILYKYFILSTRYFIFNVLKSKLIFSSNASPLLSDFLTADNGTIDLPESRVISNFSISIHLFHSINNSFLWIMLLTLSNWGPCYFFLIFFFKKSSIPCFYISVF